MDPISFLIKCATYTAGNQLRAIQRQKEEAQAERTAAREKAREENDPQYRAFKEAERAAEAGRRAARQVAVRQERRLRFVQTTMFWLSLLCGGLAFLGFLGGSAGPVPTLSWLGFGGVWLCLCFVPKHYT